MNEEQHNYERKFDWKVFWIMLGIITVLVHFLLMYLPHLAEDLYGRGLFQGVRIVLDYSLGMLPFPYTFLLIGIFIIWRSIKIFQAVKRWFKEKYTLDKILYGTIKSFLSFVFGLAFWFYLLWGANYNRIPLEDQLNLDVEELSIGELKEELNTARYLAQKVKDEFSNMDSIAWEKHLLDWDIENKMRVYLEATLSDFGYPTYGRVRCRVLGKNNPLSNLGISGMYIPFTGEAFTHEHLPYAILPFMIAHEMAHGYGFADEGSANFLAFIACTRAEDPIINYSGRLMHLLYLSSELLTRSKKEYVAFRKKFPYKIDKDIARLGYIDPKSSYGEMMSMVKSYREIQLKQSNN